MQQLSEYPGPSLDDYANVRALNIAFIKASSELKGPQRGRLAASPFLLFSFRENDPGWWEDALADQRQGDLMASDELDSLKLRGIQTAALSFLWQLSRRNPYAVRVISGATIAWCDAISELPIITLLDRVGVRGDLMLSRLDDSDVIGERLLGKGTSSERNVRRSSQLTALQALLTRPAADNYTVLSAAACKMAGPLRVLDKKM
jgi:hypothetical protein